MRIGTAGGSVTRAIVAEPPGDSITQTGLPPGITQSELEEHYREQEAFTKAASAVLPGSLRDAFADGWTKLNCFWLRPLTMGDCIAIVRIGSPILHHPKTFTRKQLVEMIHLLTISPREALEWSEQRMRGTARLPKLLPRKMSDFALATLWYFLEEHCARGFETFISYSPPSSLDGSIVVQTCTDGLGWWFMLFGMLQRDYHKSRHEALETTVAEAWSLWSHNCECEGWKRNGRGYIGQEAERYMKREQKA